MSGPDPIGGGGDTLAALRDGRIQGQRARLEASAQLLEGVFYQQLFQAMRDTVPEGGMISGGQGQEMFEGLLDERIAEAAALSSERGLGRALYRHFADQLGLREPTEQTAAAGGSDPAGTSDSAATTAPTGAAETVAPLRPDDPDGPA